MIYKNINNLYTHLNNNEFKKINQRINHMNHCFFIGTASLPLFF